MTLHTAKSRLGTATFAVMTLFQAMAAPAVERFWDGGGRTGNWTAGANWVSRFGREDAPDPDDNLTFPAGAARLTNTNDFAAGTAFGAITYSGAGYSASGNQVAIAAGLNVTHGAGNTVIGYPIALDASQSFTVSAGANLFLNGNIGLGIRVLTVTGQGQTIASGGIAGAFLSGRIVKSGSGTLRIFGTASYSGSTSVNEGTLVVDGSLTNSRVTVNNRGTLRGEGTVSGITANSGGTVSPGGTTTDALNSSGDVVLNAGSTLNIRLNGTTAELQYDQIDVTGAVTLGGTLNVTVGFAVPVGTVFTIIDNDGIDAIAGTFAGLPEGATLLLNGRPFRISYGGRFGGIGGRENDVTLEAIPALSVWDAGGGQNKFWSEPLNWAGDQPPQEGDDIQFANPGSGTVLATNDFPAGRRFGSIIFAGGKIRLDGNAATLDGNIQNSQAGEPEIALPVALAGGFRLTEAVKMTITGAITLSGAQSFRVEHPNSRVRCDGGVDMAGHNLTVFAAVTGDALGNLYLPAIFGDVTGPGTFTKTGPGRMSIASTGANVMLTIDEAHVYAGALGGTTILNAAGSLDAGSLLHNLNVAGGTLGMSIFGTDVTGTLRFVGGGTLYAPIFYNTAQNPAISGYLRPRSGSLIDLTGGTLDVRVLAGAQITRGMTIAQIQNFFQGTVTGTFNGLPNGVRFTRDGHAFTINYSEGGTVSVTLDLPFVWDGGGSGTQWTEAANWQPDVAVIAGADMIFPVGVSDRLAINDFAPATIFRTMTFGRNSYIVGGNALRLTDGITNGFSSGATAIVADLTLLGAGFPIDVAGASDLRLSGAVSGNMDKTGTGTLTLSGNDNNTLGGRILDGTVSLKKSGATALSGLHIGDGTLAPVVRLGADHQFADDAVVTVAAQARLDLDGHSDAIASLLGAGSVDLGDGFDTGRLTVAGGSLAGTISGSGGLTKSGTFALILAGTNSFFGTTIVNEGTLGITGSLNCASLSVAGAATLDVDGTLTMPGAVQLQGGLFTGTGTVPAINASGGVLKPGSISAGFQVALRSGSLTMNSAATFRSLLTGVDPGFEVQKLSVTGSVNLGSAVFDLDRLSGPVPAAGKVFVLIENDGADAVTSTFAGLPQGAVFSQLGLRWQITYTGGTGNDVAITLIELLPPEITAFLVQPGTGSQAGQDVIDIDGTGIAGITYDLESSTDLVTWTVRQARTANSSTGALDFSIANPPSVRRSYVRIRGR